MTTADPKRKTLRLNPIALGLLGLIMMLAGAAIFDFFLFRHYMPMGGKSFNHGHNGLWLRYTWYFGEKSDDELAVAIQNMMHHQIDRAYFHVLDIDQNGQLTKHNRKQAKKIMEMMQSLHPACRGFAWISLGDWYPAHGTDISRIEIRERIGEECRWLTEDCHFDGVQIDYEPCKDSDPNFLLLIDEVRKHIPTKKLISVATPMLMDPPVGVTWSKKFFTEVAEKSDELAVMCYDSHLPHPRLYSRFVAGQVQQIVELIAAKNPNCRVMIGLPAYDRDFMHDHTETLYLGLNGVRQGLEQVTDNRPFEGVALFADYTMDEAEWQEFNKYWLEREP